MNWRVAKALMRLVEYKDQTTAAHTWRVALFAQALWETMGQPLSDLRSVMIGAALHDIGKVDIPTTLLTKTEALTQQEMDVIRRHTVLGHERLLRLGVNNPIILSIVRSHHERIDGSGYPDQLIGDEIPAPARCFAVIDAFDAMTSARPYRDATGKAAQTRAISELNAHAGQWYCPEAVRAFTGLFERGSLQWILDEYNDEQTLARLSSLPQRSQLDELLSDARTR